MGAAVLEDKLKVDFNIESLKTEYTVLHLCGGIGGGTIGFNGARSEFMGKVGRFRTLCSIDVDPIACKNYETITGSKAVQMDLFSRQQYIDFFGKEPPDTWREMTPADILDACDGICPDVVFTSPPCKGFSGLLPEKSAKSKKYQALNLLTIRSIELCLEAFADDLPSLILLENVPRIQTRGKDILEKIKKLLRKAGYAVSDENHDCGELGGLGQHRRRYLLIARNEQKLNSFVYKPAKRKLRTIGDVLKHMPLPGDTQLGGPLHKLPNLEWKTWVRLGLIPAGGDWRDLNQLDWWNYRITYEPRGAGAYGVQDWNRTGNTVIGNARISGSSAGAAVSDPRLAINADGKANLYRIVRYDKTAQCITGAVGPSNGAICVADPRVLERENRHPGVYSLSKEDKPAPCFTGTRFGSGAIVFADPRVQTELHPDCYGIQDWEKPSKTIRASSRIMQCASSISDPRLNCSPRAGTMGVMDWEQTAGTVIGSSDIHAGAAAISDPRIPDDNERGVYVIVAEDETWHRPLTTAELAWLQDFPLTLPDGRPFQLEGCSDSMARMYVGNAVPASAARAMAEVMLFALMSGTLGYFMLSHAQVWVSPEQTVEETYMIH
ncbi:DNA cytosine methyltransferase [Cohnella sp. AR92]|uniref:DNA cytosine methyltransferase n=1 Tax=Cohnella sp. AR92 TaxID=648716 RepID=UPI000F8D1C35|nr:DNA cytosine methyltransferase [Cohnella sp. AR92]RUS44924.1 DNA cytosine methyltransferase [Cohnella sp. AR92]